MESKSELDVFNHKNKSKILLSFLDGKNEIVSGIGLQQLLQFIKEKDYAESISVALQQNDEACWLCAVKEKLFKGLWNVCDGTAKIIATEDSLASSKSDNEPLPVDRIWKVVRNAGNLEDHSGVIIVRRRKPTDGEEIESTAPLQPTNEMNDKNSADWKTLCVNVAEVLLKYSDESLPSDLSLGTDEKPQSCTFAVATALSDEELKSRMSSLYVCRHNHGEESLSMVQFQICYKCLSHISFDVYKPEKKAGVVHSVAQLVNHLIATLYVTANEFCEQNLAVEARGFSSEEQNNEIDAEKPCEPVTVVCRKDKNDDNCTTEFSQNTRHSPNHLQFQKPGCSIGPPITVSLSSCIFNNSSTVKESPIHNDTVTRGGLRASKLPATFKFQCKKSQCLRQTKPLVSLSGQNGAKFPVVTIVGKNGVLAKRKPVLSTLPGVSATFKKISNAKTFTLKPDQRKRLQNFTLTTVDPKSETNRPKCKKYLLKMLHPTTSNFNQTVATNNKVIRVIQSTASPLAKLSAPVKTTNLFRKLNIKTEPFLTKTPIVKGHLTKLCTKNGFRRKVKVAQLASKTSTSREATAPKKHSTPASIVNETPEAISNAEPKVPSQQSVDGSSKQTRVKTPSKRKGTGQGASMNSIVRDFLATSSSVQKAEQNNTMAYNTKRQRRGRRRRQGSTNKIIPVPYESHYLCIYETLAKKGWKAYWFRKCRCARSGRKKIPEEPIQGSTSQHNSVNGESTKQQAVGRNRKRKMSLKVDASLYKRNKKELSETSLPVAKFSSTSMNTSNNSSKLQDLISENDFLGSMETEPVEADVVSNEDQPDSSAEYFSDDITVTCDIDVAEQYQPEESDEIKASNSSATPAKQLSRTELLTRRKKVESLHKTILKQNIRGKNGTLELQQNNTLCSVIMQPYVFSQFFQEMDKQPSCLDVVSVHSSVVQEFPDLRREAVGIERKRNSRRSALLKPLEVGNVSSGKSAADSANDLLPIWAFGKSEQFFLEKKKTMTLQRKKIILEKRKQAILKKQKNFEKTKKGSSDAGQKLMKSLEARSILKRSLLAFGKKAHRHRSCRPKATKILVSKKYYQNEEENVVPVFGFKPCSSSWNVPLTSVSEVVRKLEHVWCEEEEFRGFVGLRSVQNQNGLVTLTPALVNHALSALKASNETFTFSSKKKKGKNTVLLISRKLITSPESNSQEEDKDASSSNSLASPILSKQRKISDHEHIDGNGDPISPKLLLKLRKTGEVSGSAIYSVPKPPIFEEENPHPAVCDSAAVPSQCCDVNTTEANTSSTATDFDMLSLHSQENESLLDKEGEVNPKSNTKQVGSDCNSPQVTHEFLDHHHFSAVTNVSAAIEGFVVDALPASPLKSVSATNFTLENDAEMLHRSVSELGNSLCVKDNNILSSTVISSTPIKVSPNSLDFPSAVDDYENLESTSFCDAEKKDHEEMFGENILEELLQFISVDSLDVLERVFISDQNNDIFPVDLLKKLKAGAGSDRSSGKRKLNMSGSRAACSFEKKRYPCIANGSFTCSQNENKKISSLFSSFDSPETVRGMSQSKKQDDDCNTESFPALNSPTESEREFQSSPSTLPPQELDVASGVSPLNQQMKMCNVILKPLEGILKDFKTNGNTSCDGLNSQLYHNEYNSFNLSSIEPSARELNRLLKNQALNGAYWKPIASDPRSPVSFTPASHWHFRDRRKRTHSESTSVVNEDLILEKQDEVVVDEEEREIPQRKRKKTQYVKYLPSSDESLHEIADSLWNDGSNLDKGSVSESVKPRSLNCEAFQSLFKNRLNCDLVRSWILSGTLSRPRPLRFPFMFARKNATKQQTAFKTNSRDVSDVVTSSGDESGRVQKKNTKVPGRDLAAKRSKSVPPQDDAFEELRQALFKSRHPHYKGDLCNGSSHINPPARLNKRLSLLRVNAEEARKQDCPSLCMELLVEADKKHLIRKQKTVRPASESDDAQKTLRNEEETLIVSSYRKIDEEIKKNAVVVPLETIETHPIEMAAPVALSSRGRALKPSMRNRNQNLLVPTRNRRSSSVSLLVMKKPALPPSPNPSLSPQEDSPTTRNREKARFVHKHSTSGSYIQKIIESGLYDD